MRTVGLRELKNNLSKYVRAVEETGLVIRIADRGRVIAEISPPAATPPDMDPEIAELVRQGRMTPATKKNFDYPLLPKALKRGSARRLLDWTRGER